MMLDDGLTGMTRVEHHTSPGWRRYNKRAGGGNNLAQMQTARLARLRRASCRLTRRQQTLINSDARWDLCFIRRASSLPTCWPLFARVHFNLQASPLDNLLMSSNKRCACCESCGPTLLSPPKISAPVAKRQTGKGVRAKRGSRMISSLVNASSSLEPRGKAQALADVP